jgi:hypothetical protein
MARTSSSSGEVEGEKEEQKQQLHKEKKKALGWIEWLRGWLNLIYEILFQRIIASHLQNPLPLPPANDLSCIVTGSTSGIGREIARFGSHCLLPLQNKANLILTRFLFFVFFGELF